MPAAAVVTVEGSTLAFGGDWLLSQPLPVVQPPAQLTSVDLTGVTSWDSSLAATLWKLRQAHPQIQFLGASASLQQLLALSEATTAVPHRHPVNSRRFKAAVWLHKAREATASAIVFLGDIFIHLFQLIRHRQHFRQGDWLLELHEAGARALPIVTFLSFLVGLILAFVSAIQLQLFGASIYVADLVGLSMTREMGALITAIIMAGRTGAAYAAQIGSMKRSEELDALRTMGLSPIHMVVLPKVVALTAMMPLLAVFSAFVGIFAGLVVGDSVLNLSVFQYINQTALAVAPKNFFIGIIKAVVYGFLVAYAGAWRGMRCGDSADAVGRAATSAVVLSLTLIVVANAIFAILLNALKI